jgi:carbamoyltransferase
VLREHVADWFELDCDSPYMLLVAGVTPARRRAMTADELKLWGIDQLNVVRSDIPAVTHVDYSARIQTVHADTNPRFHQLLDAFHGLAGCPVLVNTSRMRSAASWAPTSGCWRSAIACCASRSRIRR